MRGKAYFALYLFYQNVISYIYRLIFILFGAKIGTNTKFANKPEICGYISKINFGNKCFIDKNVCFVVNKEGKIQIKNNTLISYNVIINAGVGSITIGENTMIAANTYIINNDHAISENLSVRNSSHITKDIVIGDNVWVGANCTILKGVNIGDGSIIGAGSVVTKNIPPYSIAFGVPCRVIKDRFERNLLIEKLRKSGYSSVEINNLLNKVE